MTAVEYFCGTVLWDQQTEEGIVPCDFPFDGGVTRYVPEKLLDFQVDSNADKAAEWRRFVDATIEAIKERIAMKPPHVRWDAAEHCRRIAKLGGRKPLPRESRPATAQAKGEPGWYKADGTPIARTLEGVTPEPGKRAFTWQGVGVVYRDTLDA